jgi:hypothetical protein
MNILLIVEKGAAGTGRCRGSEAPPDLRSAGFQCDTMKRTARSKTTAKHDWSRLDAMTEAEKHSAAMNDPDNRPLTEEDMKRMKRAPRAKIIRRALGLSQEEFAALPYSALHFARLGAGLSRAGSGSLGPDGDIE